MTSSLESFASAVQVDFDPFSDGEILLTAPLSEAQREIWASVQMGPEANCAYNESQELWLRGPLNHSALTLALQQLVDRHEALRSTCSPDGTTLCIGAGSFDVSFTDLSTPTQQHQTPQHRTEQVEALRRQTVETAFDLEHGPLFRVQVLKLDESEHLVLMTAHHIVCDGWSWAVLVTDLAQLYTALCLGETPDLEAPDAYSTYATSLAEGSADEAQETLNYWCHQFADAVPVVDFPTDHLRPALRTFNSAREDYVLPPELVTQLKHLSVQGGSSFMTLLLAAFEVFLSRLTHQSDLVVGVPAAGQAATGQFNLVGHCVNLLPLRTQIDPQQSFSAYLEQRKTSVLDAYDHQQFTFGRLVQELQLARDPSRIPLVPIVFNIDQGLEVEKLGFEGLAVEFRTIPRAYENFELFINAVELQGAVTLECQYNTNLFDESTIRRRLVEFATLLESIGADPHCAIATLPLLPEAERQWLQQMGAPPNSPPPQQTLIAQFEAQVSHTPTQEAVAFATATLTYEQLNRQANQLARYLLRQGVRPGQFVGICVERSQRMIVALLAILKAGGVYVPLDPSHPPQRLALILEDAQVPVLITQTHLVSELPEHQAQIVCVETVDDEVAQYPHTNLEVNIPLSQLAYILYTSGSTGRPKGVQITHGNLANLLYASQQELNLSAADTVLAITTIAFDISALELFLPLTLGAKIAIASREVAKDSTLLMTQLHQSGATFLQATPATWQMLLTIGWSGNRHLKALCGGEVLPHDLARQLATHCQAAWNGYGPTEASIYTTMHRIEAAAPSSSAASTSIGRPLANVQTHILDDHQQPLPPGIPGELCIAGAGLAQGYLNRPTLTAEKFVSAVNTAAQASSPRLYRTGDLVRYLPDGTLEWLGRLDNQVKIRGFRIELGEIESQFRQHPDVQEAVVILREENAETRLVGYFVSASATAVSEHITQLREYLKKRLPDYMVPSFFVRLDCFPLTANGKINRRALPEPDLSEQLVTRYEAPRTELEQQLAEIWAEVLGHERLGIHDNFFDLGGHSLLAIQIIARMQQIVDFELLLPQLFESPTVADFAKRIDIVRWTAQGPDSSDTEEFEDQEFEDGEL